MVKTNKAGIRFPYNLLISDVLGIFSSLLQRFLVIYFIKWMLQAGLHIRCPLNSQITNVNL